MPTRLETYAVLCREQSAQQRVVVDVFAQSPTGTAPEGIVPITGQNQPIVLGGNGQTTTIPNGLTNHSNGQTTTTTTNGVTTTTSNGQQRQPLMELTKQRRAPM